MTAGASSGRQLLLDFPRIDAAQRPLLEMAAQQAARGAIRRWRNWPEGQLALTGEPFSGRTNLLRIWASDTGAALVTGPGLAAADIDEIAGLSITALAVDDADQCSNGRALLAAINLCRDRRAPILLSGRGDPGGWFADPKDLRSRMQAMPAVAIEEPDEEGLALRLIEECARRYIVLPEESAGYLAQRMERSWAAVGLLVDEIERSPDKASSPRNARNILISLGIDPG
ncbi:MAG: DNA replication ATPase [Alphaproteobacteria bacterium]|nr:DNA replication ATPase [Alphaproteobacteria bacterium]